jgi:4-amino-4-deoxy-L-arabinose transferase-like glycosyltransferase
MLGLGILAGIVLNMVRWNPAVSRVPWYDPFVVTTVLMFVWLLIAAGIVAFYRPAREGRRVAYLTLVSFVFLVIALGVGLSGRTEHGGQGQTEARVQAAAPGGFP